MKDGFIKAAAGTIDVVVADVQYNSEQILARMREADAAGVNLLTLPELCLTGYTCGDLFFSDCPARRGRACAGADRGGVEGPLPGHGGRASASLRRKTL